MHISRRGFVAAAGAMLSGCGARRVPLTMPTTVAGPHLARVKVAEDRVIRTLAGLRPFRPSGFVVRAEKMGDKLVVHNYGHGGAGITLSWGTSLLAIEAAARPEARDCAVIGCGVVGLSTARLLQLRGYNPTIYARDLPPSTTSNVAGGLWEPVSLYDDERVTPEFRKQFGEASRLAFRRYQSMASERYGVKWLPLYQLRRSPIAAPPANSLEADIEGLYPEIRKLGPGEHPFAVPYVKRRYSMLIEPAIYLQALIRDFQLSGGKIVVRELRSRGEVLGLRESTVFNCSGLGARELFGDRELLPIKGQLAFLMPQPEIDYMTIGPTGYMFPRHDGILLGGSFERGVESTEVVPETIGRILRDSAAVFGGMRG
jgi:D-amino-acid oxidase